SHEIRTPMNAVLGMNEMILRECEQEEILEYANNIERAGHTLLSLIEDILDISKIEAGRVEIFPVEYEMNTVMRDLVNIVRVKAEEKGLELNLEFAKDLPNGLFGDELRVKQVWINILNNAVKYTQKGKITFHVEWEKTKEDEILIKSSISDTGIGMREEEIGNIFEAFQRLDIENNRNIEGTGLGMTIAYRLLELMRGGISIESEYGKGTTVYLDIPQQVYDWTAANFQGSNVKSRGERKKYRASFTAPEVKLLAVDDNSMNLEVFKGFLKKTKIQVDLALSGMEALEIVKKVRYDLIFMDHMMPQMDGIETMRRIRQSDENQNADTPMIALTANATVGSEQKYLEAGFEGYLPKPVKAEKLEQVLLEYLPEEKIIKQDVAQKQEQENEEKDLGNIREELLQYEVDLDEGLSYLGGDFDQYLEAAKIFLKNSVQRRELMKKMLAEGDTDGYTIQVHSLKSNGALLGSRKLSAVAEECEEQGINGNLDYLREREKELDVIWSTTERGICCLIDRIEIQETEKEQGPGIDAEEFSSQKGKLAEWVQQYEEEEAVDMIDELLERGANEEQSQELRKIKELLEEFEYEQALQLLEL
ncbi:MAG: response regulator, partial [Lachnospiraceae bacterium]|nr:response regulator [Lachnospiraceae bacterium]